MSLQANALITVAEAKDHLNIPSSETKYDSQIEDLVNIMADMFDCYCKRTLKQADHTEYLDGEGDDTLYVTHYPINTSVSSVVMYYDLDRSYDADTKLENDELAIYASIGKIRWDNGVFAEWPQCIKITYNGGYATVPGDLKIATKEAIAFFYKRKRESIEGVSSVSTSQGGSVSYTDDDLPKPVRAILDRYKRW
jgi:hypothetical protein